ncbi:hypothetical protein CR513_56619, partial [Mucuna pruriens]
MENKGHVVIRPPLFKGQNYDYWKQRMIEFFDACHIDMWDVVKNKMETTSSTFITSKDLKKHRMEELLGTLKVHEIELKEDEGQIKGKSIDLKAQKTQKGSSSKAFKA